MFNETSFNYLENSINAERSNPNKNHIIKTKNV